jgi:hypothetical protein
MVEEAEKLGFNFEELEEYGFNLRDMACGNSCPQKRQFFEIDKLINGSDRIVEKGLREYNEIVRKASCHPMIKDNVPP